MKNVLLAALLINVGFIHAQETQKVNQPFFKRLLTKPYALYEQWQKNKSIEKAQPSTSTWFENRVLVPWKERKLFRSFYPIASQPTVPATITEFAEQNDLPGFLPPRKLSFSGKRTSYFGPHVGQEYAGMEPTGFASVQYAKMPYWQTKVKPDPYRQGVVVRSLPSYSRIIQRPSKEILQKEFVDLATGRSDENVYTYNRLQPRGINSLYEYVKEKLKKNVHLE
jgi:hypothetical protein